MKRWIGLLAAAAIAVVLPTGHGTDVAKLSPVEVVYIYMEEGKVCVQADTGDLGTGYSWQGALEDMQLTSSAEVFLETAEYILVTEQTRQWIPELAGIFRPSAKLLLVTGEVEVTDLLPFLRAQTMNGDLKDFLVGKTTLPKLMIALGRYYIV